MEIEKGRACEFNDVVHWPSISPPVKGGSELDGVEACCNIGDDPEDKPKSSPGRANDHGHVFTCEAECGHTCILLKCLA